MDAFALHRTQGLFPYRQEEPPRNSPVGLFVVFDLPHTLLLLFLALGSPVPSLPPPLLHSPAGFESSTPYGPSACPAAPAVRGHPLGRDPDGLPARHAGLGGRGTGPWPTRPQTPNLEVGRVVEPPHSRSARNRNYHLAQRAVFHPSPVVNREPRRLTYFLLEQDPSSQ